MFFITTYLFNCVIRLATCRPACENGGSCLSDNRCSCVPGFRGDRCLIGEQRLHLRNMQLHLSDNLCSCEQAYRGDRCQYGEQRRQIRNMQLQLLVGQPLQLLSWLPGDSCLYLSAKTTFKLHAAAAAVCRPRAAAATQASVATATGTVSKGDF